MIFSILMPTYNQSAYISEAILSIIHQTYTEWELIIINDGSNDQTQQIIEDFTKKDNRIKYFCKENGGTVSALNVGLQNSKGDWIFWLSSDDLFEKDKLKIHYEYIVNNNEINFIHTNHYLLHNKNNAKEKSNFNAHTFIHPQKFQSLNLLNLNYINGISISFSRKIFEEIGYFDINYKAGHDFDYWLRVSLRYNLYYINLYTSTTRIHSEQDTNTSVYRGMFDSAISGYNALSLHSNKIFKIDQIKNEEDLNILINYSLRLITNKYSYIRLCGFEEFFIDKLCLNLYKEYGEVLLKKLAEKINQLNSEEESIKHLRNKLEKITYLANNPIVINPYKLMYRKALKIRDVDLKLSLEMLDYIEKKRNEFY